MASFGLHDVTDVRLGLDPAQLTFSAPKKLTNGVVVSLLYKNKPLIIKTCRLTCPFDVTRGFKGKDGTGGADPKDANSKVEIILNVPETNDTKPLSQALYEVNAAVKKHIEREATLIFGENGLSLKKKDLEEKIKAVQSDTLKAYYALRSDDEKYAPKLKLKVPDGVNVISNTGTVLAVEEIKRNSSVMAYFKVRGFFANSLLVSVQLEAAALCVWPSSGSDVKSLFADDLETNEHAEATKGTKRHLDAVDDDEEDDIDEI